MKQNPSSSIIQKKATRADFTSFSTELLQQKPLCRAIYQSLALKLFATEFDIAEYTKSSEIVLFAILWAAAQRCVD